MSFIDINVRDDDINDDDDEYLQLIIFLCLTFIFVNCFDSPGSTSLNLLHLRLCWRPTII